MAAPVWSPDVNSWPGASAGETHHNWPACSARRGLYRLSARPSMRNQRIARPHFRVCLTCMSRSLSLGYVLALDG